MSPRGPLLLRGRVNGEKPTDEEAVEGFLTGFSAGRCPFLASSLAELSTPRRVYPSLCEAVRCEGANSMASFSFSLVGIT